MKIVVLDDYSDAFRTGPHFPRLKDHEVVEKRVHAAAVMIL